MIRRLVISFLSVLIVFGAVASQAQTATTASNASSELASTLRTIRALSDGSFQQVVWWAPNPSDPGITVPDWNNAEHQIMQLKHRDRLAVLAWLTGQGRTALYQRGASDRMIGSRDPTSFGRPSPKPSALAQYRKLNLTSATLTNGEAPPSGIVLNNGFALIAKDGKKAIVCVSFTNVAARAATNVEFSFPLSDANGDTVGTLKLDRTGLFSPNITIHGPADADTYVNNGPGPRAMFDNCLVSNQGVSALPLLQTRYAGYRVVSVHYSDGSSWP